MQRSRIRLQQEIQRSTLRHFILIWRLWKQDGKKQHEKSRRQYPNPQQVDFPSTEKGLPLVYRPRVWIQTNFDSLDFKRKVRVFF